MKKFIAILLATVISLSCLFVSAFAADDAAISSFSIESVAEIEAEAGKGDGAAVKTDWYEIEGTYYLFVPSAIDLANAKISFDADADVYAGSTKLVNGEVTDVLNGKSEITLTCSSENFKVVIINESTVASVFIETESGNLDAVHADKEHKEEGVITIVNADGLSAEYDGVLEYIKGRGNSTWGMEKKPYNIKLDKKADLFDMGKSKKWSLIANHGDESLARNVAAYYAAKEAGMPYTPLYVSCDVYINNEYMGAYLLTTRVEADETRVDVDNLDDVNEEICIKNYGEDFDMDTLDKGGVYGTWAGLLQGTQKWLEIPESADEAAPTGGYILEMEIANRYIGEISGFVTSRSQPFIMKAPEYSSKKQIEYISDYYQRFEDAVYSEDGKNSLGEHYSDLADVKSFAKFYALNEWISNQDCGLTSTYFYKPAGDKLYAGPVWDFDIGFGNNGSGRFGCDYTDPKEFTVCFGRQYRNTIFGTADVDEVPHIFNALCTKSDFVKEVKSVWDSEIKTAVDKTNVMLSTYAEANMGSAVMNAIRWNIFGTYDVTAIKTAYAKAVKDVFDFSTVRTQFLTENFGTVQVQDVETNFFLAGLKKIGTAMNNLFEKIIVAFGLENVIL